MPPTKQDRIQVPCPHCGHVQPEPPAAFSTVCKGCGRHFRVQSALAPARQPVSKPKPELEPEQKRIACFNCGSEMNAAPAAQSAMCKRCGTYIDLRDYRIAGIVSKNFKTRGALIVELKGNVYNTEAVVGDAVIKGKFLGKLIAERSLTVYSTAEIKGTFKTARLIIPPANHFRWPDLIVVGAAEIAGELAANLRAEGAIVLKSTAKVFGALEARDLVVEAGAVLVGPARIGGRVNRSESIL
jgi:cytoskeletal protein CcmA (bactofilin family)